MKKPKRKSFLLEAVFYLTMPVWLLPLLLVLLIAYAVDTFKAKYL